MTLNRVLFPRFINNLPLLFKRLSFFFLVLLLLQKNFPVDVFFPCSCYELNIKFYFSPIYLFPANHNEFFRACIGKFMCKLCCHANWMQFKKKSVCFVKFKKFFPALSPKTGLKNSNHFAYNFPAVALFVCLRLWMHMQVQYMHRSCEALKSLVANFMYKAIKYNLTQWNYGYNGG